MKYEKMLGCLIAFAILAVLGSGVISNLFEFASQLVLLQYSGPSLSIFGKIIVGALSFVISFVLVGLLFNAIGFFNGKIMGFVYSALSIIVGFILTCIAWAVETNWLIILIVLVVLFVTFFIVRTVIHKKKNIRPTEEGE